MSDNLAKMGAARVCRTSYHGIECIEKSQASNVEFQFYLQVAPAFRRAGIGVPELLASDTTTQTLTLEYIPYPIGQDALLQNPDVLSTIACIHQFLGNEGGIFKRHTWLRDKTERALELLKLPDESAAIISETEKLSACLFSPSTLISGDTNAGNWGIREQGSAVLYDWERFSTGSPAIDLAPLIKGMGNIADFVHIAKRYQEVSPYCHSPALAQEIAICKLWVVTEVIDILYRNNKVELNKYLDWYRFNLPAWLQKLRFFLNA
ncbi:aminoglycoside phosphotransferase [Buttiauxella sp. B2]|uniref:phosphotransferase family protein n=1 Tax=Buttiauxella sp. B2 TaxID=2587812 RepID=UPI00111D9DFE|nr:phosphotransferase [Buttiauxella sp. B2]TNV17911.1 aminoglycoside phosphotransferase [Buttiauxella sp. B2]